MLFSRHGSRSLRLRIQPFLPGIECEYASHCNIRIYVSAIVCHQSESDDHHIFRCSFIPTETEDGAEKNAQWNYSIGRLSSWMFPWARFMFHKTVIFSLSLSFVRWSSACSCMRCMVPCLIPILFVFSCCCWKLVGTLKKNVPNIVLEKGTQKMTQYFPHSHLSTVQYIVFDTAGIRHASLYAVHRIRISHIMLVVYCQSFSIQFSFFVLLFVAFILSCCGCW